LGSFSFLTYSDSEVQNEKKSKFIWLKKLKFKPKIELAFGDIEPPLYKIFKFPSSIVALKSLLGDP
jgi:hypothetical protein